MCKERTSLEKGAKMESRSLVTARTGKYEWHRTGTNLHEMLPRAGRPFVWSTRLLRRARTLKPPSFKTWARSVIPTIRSQIPGYVLRTWISPSRNIIPPTTEIYCDSSTVTQENSEANTFAMTLVYWLKSIREHVNKHSIITFHQFFRVFTFSMIKRKFINVEI